MMKHLSALVAALLLHAAQPLLTCASLSTTLILLAQAPAQAQSAEAIGKVAQAITVRIEGATQGSGVLVKRDGNRYTVLTAWHVVSGQRPGEELEIFTSDGQRHQLEQGSIKRLGEVDLAVLAFTSSSSYHVVPVGDVKSVSMGNQVWVSGFPLPSSAVPTRLLRLIKGDVIANAMVAIPDGYQLLYDNQTLPGVSGGAVLNAQGQLVGIHGRAEKADQVSESSGKAVATGTNQGVPISYFKQYAAGESVAASSTQAATADDYLVLAASLLDKKGSEYEAIRLVDKSIELERTAKGYSYRAYVKNNLGKFDGAVADYDQAIAISPKSATLYNNRGNSKGDLGDYAGAIADFDQAIGIDAKDPSFYANRGFIRAATGDTTGAMADYNQALSINPRWTFAYNNRGVLKDSLGDKHGAIADYKQVVELDSKLAMVYWNLGSSYYSLREFGLACKNWRVAASLGVSVAAEVVGDRSYGCR